MTLMPLTSGVMTGGKMKEFLIAAALASNVNEEAVQGVWVPNPDPDLSIPYEAIDKKETKWTTHSLRRLADKRMRIYCLANGIPLSKVDSMLGWKQAEHRLEMQEHYDEGNLRARMEVARATRSVG